MEEKVKILRRTPVISGTRRPVPVGRSNRGGRFPSDRLNLTGLLAEGFFQYLHIFPRRCRILPGAKRITTLFPF